MSRSGRRSWGKRKTAREARKNVLRILELHEKGASPSTIASSVVIAKVDILEVLGIAGKLGDDEEPQGGGGLT